MMNPQTGSLMTSNIKPNTTAVPLSPEAVLINKSNAKSIAPAKLAINIQT